MVKYKPISQYPHVQRDVSVDLPDNYLYSDAVKAAHSACDHLEKVELVSAYKRPAGKTYTFRLTFQRYDRTFTGQEVAEFVSEIRKAIDGTVEKE